MKEIEIIVDEELKNTRLDKYISKMRAEFSRNHIQKLIDDGLVKVNGKVEKKSYRVEVEDRIVIYKEAPKKLNLEKKEMDLDIIYEDNEIIIVNKPVGLIVHPVKGNKTDTLVNALLAHVEKLNAINGTLRPGIVHRLDKNTSGVILVAKTQKSLNNLQQQFKKRQTKKIYRTIVKGNLPYNSGKIDAPIGRDQNNRTKMAVVKNNSKKAVTKFKVLKRFKNYTYLEVDLKTGRTHQIRVHFSHLGFPIIGDQKYGESKTFINLDHHLLHAFKIGFYHPISKEWAEFKAKLPDSFNQVLSKIKNSE